MAPDRRLSDAQVMRFVNHGYLLLEPDLPAELHARIGAACDALAGRNPGNGIYEAVPELQQVYEHPVVRGALVSLLGDGMRMHPHRHLHTTPAGQSRSQTWHQDGTNVRHHQIRTVLAMYYPQEVTPENGPTVVLPGSHFRNAPTDRMATYANIRGQVFLTVKAGTVAIAHYDLWHAATLNRSDRPRHMLKFLFDRTEEPGAPSWNHDPVEGPRVAKRAFSEMVGPPSGYTSDYYKEWELRLELWNWLLGKGGRVPAGAFKDLLA